VSEGSRGSSSVEFALVLPLALLAGLAIVQVGLVAKDVLVVGQAAREGAREATVTTDDSRAREAALRASGLSPDRIDVAVNRSGSVGDPVTVTVRYREPFVVPFVEWLFPEQVELQSSVTMRQEIAGPEP
jgi:Flp pilus assembly protein TadG